MKTTILSRTVLAAAIGSAGALGWGVPSPALAQDAKDPWAVQSAQPQSQSQSQSDRSNDEGREQKARKEREERELRQAEARAREQQADARAREQQQADRQQEQADRQREQAAREQQQSWQRQQDEQDRQAARLERQQAQREQAQREQAQREQAPREAQDARWGADGRAASDAVPDRAEERAYAGPAARNPTDGVRDADRVFSGRLALPDARDAREANDPADERRVDDRTRERRIEQERREARDWARERETRLSDAERVADALRDQRRNQGYSYQQDYWSRLRQQRYDWNTWDYDNDPFYWTAPSYRYYRGGNYYYVNRYAAETLQRAVDYGYREGIRAGRADRYDGWRSGYRDSWAYQDASYGYRGRYVSYREYQYYFREGFRRGYEDGYYERRRYGRYSNGNDAILMSVLSLILDLRPYDSRY